ncbi:unnamed protein product [Ascophyllum nodosum]
MQASVELRVPTPMPESIVYRPVHLATPNDGASDEEGGYPPRRRRGCGLGRAQVLITLFVLAQPVTTVLWIWVLHHELPDIQDFFDTHASAVNITVFCAVLSVLVVVLFPLGAIDLAAGYLFGLGAGFPISMATKTFGSVLCFLLSRHTCSDYVRRKLIERYDWMGALSLMMRERQYRTMALLRFSVLPAALKNYACGGLPVSLWVYTIVTAMSLSVESLLLVPVGAKFESLEGMMHRKHSPQEKVAIVLGVVLLVALILAIRRTVRLQIEQMKRDVDSRPDEREGDVLAEEDPEERESSARVPSRGGVAVRQAVEAGR